VFRPEVPVRDLLAEFGHGCFFERVFGEYLGLASRTPKPIFVLASSGGGRSSGRIFFAGIENRRSHDRAVLGEGVGAILDVAILDVVPALQGRKLRP
jgi:hypothetical protein